MAEGFSEAVGSVVVHDLIQVIHEQRSYLSEIDGAIGDGDHGINMDKGFSLTAKRMEGQILGLSESLKLLGDILVEEIGGSMGPLYGTFFKKMARVSKGVGVVDGRILEQMLESAYQGILAIGDARVGDKTMVDTLDPAVKALKQANAAALGFAEALDAMVEGAYAGWQSTKDMVARVGRASRLGERSRGTLDAGATSCYLIIKTLAQSMKELSKCE